MKKFEAILWTSVAVAFCFLIVILSDTIKEDRDLPLEEYMYSQLGEFIYDRSGSPKDLVLADFGEVRWRAVLTENELMAFTKWLTEDQFIWKLEEIENGNLLDSVPESATEGIFFSFWMDEPNWLSGQVWRSDVAAVVYFEGDMIGARWISKAR